MKPIPETIETAAELGRFDPDVDVLQQLQRSADEVSALVPHCIGLSLAWMDEGIAFTLVATETEIAALDAVRYLENDPCVDVVRHDREPETSERDLLNEREWQLFAQTTAASRVRSTLTLPLLTAGQVTGSANLYAASDDAFEGHHEALARILGASAAHVVRNADLSFTSRQAAVDSPASARDQNVVDIALGMLISAFGLDASAAQQRMDDAARRAGLTREQFAHALVNLY